MPDMFEEEVGVAEDLEEVKPTCPHSYSARRSAQKVPKEFLSLLLLSSGKILDLSDWLIQHDHYMQTAGRDCAVCYQTFLNELSRRVLVEQNQRFGSPVSLITLFHFANEESEYLRSIIAEDKLYSAIVDALREVFDLS